MHAAVLLSSFGTIIGLTKQLGPYHYQSCDHWIHHQRFSGYFTDIASSSMKTVADRHRHPCLW